MFNAKRHRGAIATSAAVAVASAALAVPAIVPAQPPSPDAGVTCRKTGETDTEWVLSCSGGKGTLGYLQWVPKPPKIKLTPLGKLFPGKPDGGVKKMICKVVEQDGQETCEEVD